MGAYRTDAGKPYILDCVKQAEERILASAMDHEYSGIDGNPSYRARSAALAFGEDSEVIHSNRVGSCQTLSGTGSLRVGFDFLRQWFPNQEAKIYVPDPTWPTHRGIAEKAGFEWGEYRYYDRVNRSFDVEGMLQDLRNMPDEQIVILHSCAHNPTGQDPSQEQWERILEVVLEKGHFAGFDNAYQGFASGDLAKDRYSVARFAEKTDRLCVFQSFAKNFGLYGERAGNIHFLASNADEAKIVNSRLKQFARPMYSNPPIHGARVVDIILGDPELTHSWHQDLLHMSGRIAEMRAALVTSLAAAGSTHDWSHITNQIGMFAYTGLSKAQVDDLIGNSSIYLTADGRISLAGINTHNLSYIAGEFHRVSDGVAL